jgi:hypothetical protein
MLVKANFNTNVSTKELELLALLGDDPREVKEVETGAYLGGLNFEHGLAGCDQRSFNYKYPDLPLVNDDYLNCYGVCDTPQQFLELARDVLNKDPREFVISFCHIAKDPGNKNRGGGWRWHKWGPYIGTGMPQCEYLDDEDGFDDGVYVYHVHQVGGPEMKRSFPYSDSNDLRPAAEVEQQMQEFMNKSRA